MKSVGKYTWRSSPTAHSADLLGKQRSAKVHIFPYMKFQQALYCALPRDCLIYPRTGFDYCRPF